MDTKVGVFICKGCEIAKSLDIDKLIEVATDECQVPVCKVHDMLCSLETVAHIKTDIEKEGLNRAVIAACSQRVFPELFDFGADVLVDRTNLREQVAWCHTPNDEDTQMLAQDIIRAAVAKVRNSEPPVPHIEETNKDIMVVGGGITGMTAARAASKAGYKVNLIEKEDHLGGWAIKWPKIFPKSSPYDRLKDPDYDDLIKEVESDPNISVYKSTTVEKTAGQPGKFDVTLKNGSGPEKLLIGSIVLATGWKPYEAEKLTHLGYGASPNIITNIQMEDMAASGDIKKPSDGKPIDSIAFIQCAGSRDQDHLPYCSAVCCRVSLKQALYVREKYPDAKIYIIYKDVRSPAQFELFYASVQDDDAIFFTKGEIAGIAKGGDGKIEIDVEETLFGEDIKIKTDMVVLAAGMVPTTKVDEEEIEETESAQPEEEEKKEEKLPQMARKRRRALKRAPEY